MVIDNVYQYIMEAKKVRGIYRTPDEIALEASEYSCDEVVNATKYYTCKECGCVSVDCTSDHFRDCSKWREQI